MRFSGATIDFWLYVSGHSKSTASNPNPDPYSDYQRHHWEIMPSNMTIDTTLNNKPSYTWTLNGRGYDDNGSWSAINQSLTSQAQVWINSSGMVVLTQTNASNNALTETGTNNTTHPTSELIWPPLTWSPNLNTPTSLIHSDGSLPHYYIVSVPTAGKKSLSRLAYDPGVGGRDYTGPGIVQFFQKPEVVGATAWWAWTINLAP